MGRIDSCNNRDCTKKGDKACGRCRSVYYCCRECQKADYPAHKAVCQMLADRGGHTPEELAPTVTEWQAQDLVRKAALELDGRFSTSSRAMPPGSASQIYDDRIDGMPALDALDASAYAAIQDLSSMGPQYERLMGQAGACVLYAEVLDRVLAGRSWIPLFHVCTGISGLIATSAKNRAIFGNTKGIESLTRALSRAAQARAMRIMQAANFCFHALSNDSAHCAKFAAAGTWDVVQQCLVTAASCPEGADASYALCGTLDCLRTLSLACKDAQCPHVARMGSIHPGLLPALDDCLQRVVDAGDGNYLKKVIDAIQVATLRDDKQLVGNVPALATPRVCRNLVRACAFAVSPLFLANGRVYDTHWTLAASLCRVVGTLALDGAAAGVPAKLHAACPHVVKMMRFANAEGYATVQMEACFAVDALSTDANNSKRLLADGVHPLHCEALRQLLGHGEGRFHKYALQRLWTISEDMAGGLSPGPMTKDTCKLLVDSLKILLASGERGAPSRGAASTKRVADLVGYWGRIIVAVPACRQHLVAAGAQEALSEAIVAAEAAGDDESASLFRTVKDKSLAGPKGMGKGSR